MFIIHTCSCASLFEYCKFGAKFVNIFIADKKVIEQKPKKSQLWKVWHGGASLSEDSLSPKLQTDVGRLFSFYLVQNTPMFSVQIRKLLRKNQRQVNLESFDTVAHRYLMILCKLQNDIDRSFWFHLVYNTSILSGK